MYSVWKELLRIYMGSRPETTEPFISMLPILFGTIDHILNDRINDPCRK